MTSRDAKPPHSTREQTDESLQAERDGSDAAVALVEERADAVLRLARERADDVVAHARARADKLTADAPAASRDVADAKVAAERCAADAGLKTERRERKRYLEDFLVTEREATDQNLVDEREHADEVVSTRDDLLSTVCHDLRGMLSALGLSVELLVQSAPLGKTGESVRSHVLLNKRQLSRMNRLVNDLLDVASIETGKLAVLPEPTLPAALVAETVDVFLPVATLKGLSLETKIGAGTDVELSLDGGRLLQVLANVVSNAIKFTKADGHITIAVSLVKDELRFCVTDTGIGIPADALELVFERHRQLSKKRGGLGLGLHISKNIVEAHGGTMWAESELGKGSAVTFTLPVKGRA